MDKEFETHREHLKAVAYRMLGSATEADDAVQETWLRLARSDTGDVHNFRAWLTTVLARVCLDMLRARAGRREVPLETALPERGRDPEQQALLAESVGLALLVVLDTLSPAERLAFVLHDMFAVPFDEIAPILGRSTDATKMLASRARRRVRTVPAPDSDLPATRHVVDAFLAAARTGDLAALLELLDPEVTVRADASEAPTGGPRRMRGARAVGRQAIAFSHQAEHARVGLVDGAPAILVEPHGRLEVVMLFTIASGKIVAIDIVTDPHRLSGLSSIDASDADDTPSA